MIFHMLQLLLHLSLIPSTTAELVDVIDFQKQSFQNLMTKKNLAQSVGKLSNSLPTSLKKYIHRGN